MPNLSFDFADLSDHDVDAAPSATTSPINIFDLAILASSGAHHQHINVRLHPAPHRFVISATTSRQGDATIDWGSEISRSRTAGICGKAARVSVSILPTSSSVENG